MIFLFFFIFLFYEKKKPQFSLKLLISNVLKTRSNRLVQPSIDDLFSSIPLLESFTYWIDLELPELAVGLVNQVS